jgi:hypothetical protein
MGLLDMFRPKWKHSDRAVRLQALGQLTVASDLSTLRRMLERDPADDIRLAAAKKIGEDDDALTRLTDAYEKASDESALDALVVLAKGNQEIAPHVARFVVSNLLIVVPGDVTLQAYQGEEKLGELICLNPHFLAPLFTMGSLMTQALTELRDLLSTLKELHSQNHGWRFHIIQVNDKNQIQMSTKSPSTWRDQSTLESLARYVFNLESVKNEIVEAIEATGSDEALALLKQLGAPIY